MLRGRCFFQNIQPPKVVVCDGRRGLLQALKEVFPGATIQRCIIHIVRYARSLLTQKPRYEAGQELSQLIAGSHKKTKKKMETTILQMV